MRHTRSLLRRAPAIGQWPPIRRLMVDKIDARLMRTPDSATKDSRLRVGHLHNVCAVLPLNRIGPVGRPVGEPPAGSSVISNS